MMPNTFTCKNQNGSPIDPHTAIFPIVKNRRGDDRSFLVGTGFFITRIGHFVTAKHVIFDALDKHGNPTYGLDAIHFVRGAEILVRNITKICYSNTSDVAIGKMDFHVVTETQEPLLNLVPKFTTEIPRENSPVATFAYPFPETDREYYPGSKGKFAPNVYFGQFLSHSETPRDKVLVSWPHFTTSINLQGGASGGPVFDEFGRVFGINSVGGLQDLSYMARVAELLPLTVHEFPVDRDRPEPNVYQLAQQGQIVFDPVLQ